MPLEFADYDPDWPELATQAIAELMATLPGLFSVIEHVGSTAVPGLAAKPIIDLMAATDDLDRVVARDGDLRRLAYEFHNAGSRAGCSTAEGLTTPGHTTCMLSRPAPSQTGISDCCATTCAATRTTRPGTAP
jgi:GrpB-like predicted nucleotidyltransferase (UPF0157 family)